MNVLYKVIFLVLMIAGIAAVFLVSWFWSLLLLPMAIVLAVDIISSLLKKKNKS